MKIVDFDHYNLSAPHEMMERLRVFYTDTVGLAVGYRPPSRRPGYWLYAGDRAVLHLSEAPEGSAERSEETTFNHAAFKCSGLEECQQRLSDNGVEYTSAHIPEINLSQLFLSDPAGNGVELNFTNE